MGEQPIFSCNAHVFHIDPKTKRTWITASTKAVSVSFFYDSSRNLYRIISVEGSKAVINSTITPNMTFTQTSQKFGQWSDVRANTVYGLGFSSEAELAKFVEKFQEVKEATKNALAKSAANGSSVNTPITSANTSPVISKSSITSQNDTTDLQNDVKIEPPVGQQDPYSFHVPQAKMESPSHKNVVTISNSNASANSGDLGSAVGVPTGMSNSVKSGQAPGAGANNISGAGGVVDANLSAEQQLKYENERLKLALAQSSANAKKWEIELATLKNNNLRLTSALQESTANVDEWKRQLHSYKEENQRLKIKFGEIETSTKSEEIAEDLKREITLLKNRIESLEKELKSQDMELKTANKILKEKSNDQVVKQITPLCSQFVNNLTELTNIQKEMEKILQFNRTT